ncbi:MAG: segregation/condensation protein A [Candidatus Bathyarchaeia archaeon]
MEELGKPFWLRPPYLILFDLLRLHRVKPWDIDIAFLLNSFLAEMKKTGYVDFSASGTALLSSSVVHRMKSELVLKMEEPPKPPTPRPTEEVPPPLPFPLRFEYTSTSVAEILRTLQEVLMNEKTILAKKPFVLSPPSVFEQMDEFLAHIEENIEEFYGKIINQSIHGVPLSFRKLVKGQSLIEMVRVFIMLLFLANQKKILLEQDESLDILIRLGQVSPPIV